MHVMVESVGRVHPASRADNLDQTSLFNTNTKKLINKMSQFDPFLIAFLNYTPTPWFEIK